MSSWLSNGYSSLLLLSKNYVNKPWAKHELKAAQTRSLIEQNEYILPLYLDNVKIDEILDTVGYIKFKNRSIEEICSMIIEKIKSGRN